MKKFSNIKKQPAKSQVKKAAIVSDAAFSNKLEWAEKNLDGVVNTPTRKAYTCEVFFNTSNEELRIWYFYDKPTLFQY